MDIDSHLLKTPPSILEEHYRLSPYLFDCTAPSGQTFWTVGTIQSVGGDLAIPGSEIGAPSDAVRDKPRTDAATS